MPEQLFALGAFLLLCIFLGSSCDREDLDREVVAPDDWRVEDREHLGNRMHLALLQQPETQLLPRVNPYVETVYPLVQDLYEQAASEARSHPLTSSVGDWNPSRTWQTTILQTDTCLAYALPGGFFYISTGLLKKLRNESELYFVMNYEIQAVVQEDILKATFEAFGPTALLAEEGDPGSADLEAVLEFLTNYQFIGVTSERLDSSAAEAICRNSGFYPGGLTHLPTSLGNWTFRTDYPDRTSKFKAALPTGCGTLQTLGRYQEEVLAVLP